MARMVDGMERMLRGEMPQPAAATKIGMRLASFATGEAIVELEADATHANRWAPCKAASWRPSRMRRWAGRT